MEQCEAPCASGEVTGDNSNNGVFQDVLRNSDHELGWIFKLSFACDIVNVSIMQNLFKEQIPVFLSYSVSWVKLNYNLSWEFWSSSDLKQNDSTSKIHHFHQIFHSFLLPWSQVNSENYFRLELKGMLGLSSQVGAGYLHFRLELFTPKKSWLLDHEASWGGGFLTSLPSA